MGFLELLSRTGVLIARIMLAIWGGLNRMWAVLAPVRLRFNTAWLRFQTLLMPLWRVIEPYYTEAVRRAKRVERALQISRKSSAITFGFAYALVLTLTMVVIIALRLVGDMMLASNLTALLLLFIIMMAFMGMGYTAFNEFKKSEHILRMSGGLCIMISIIALIPPPNWALFVFLIFLGILGVLSGEIAGGCLNPDAFDYSSYAPEATKPLHTEYSHTVSDIERRYQATRQSFERVVSRSRRGPEVEWTGGEVMEFKTTAERASEESVEFEIPSEGEVEFDLTEEKREPEVEFKETEFEISDEDEMEIEAEDAFELMEEPPPGPTTVRDIELVKKKKEMPSDVFEIE